MYCEYAILAIDFYMLKKPPTSLHPILASRLRAGRERMGLSQAALAEALGVSPGYVGDMESMKKFPSARILERLALVLGTKAYHLLVPAGEEPEPEYGELAYGIGNGLKQAIDEELREILSRYASGKEKE